MILKIISFKMLYIFLIMYNIKTIRPTLLYQLRINKQTLIIMLQSASNTLHFWFVYLDQNGDNTCTTLIKDCNRFFKHLTSVQMLKH